MTQPITAKSPSEILESLDDMYCEYDNQDDHRSLLSSLIEYAIAQLPEPQMFGKELSIAILERNSTISDCIAALRKVQSEVGV